MCNTCETSSNFVDNSRIISSLLSDYRINTGNMTPVSLIEKMDEKQYKNTFLKEVQQHVEESFNDAIGNMEQRLRRIRGEIDDYRRYLSRAVEQQESLVNSIAAINKPKTETSEKVAAEIIKIKDLDKVQEVLYGNGRLTFLTKPLYIYDAENDVYYESASYLITVDLRTADVRINSTNRKQGFWTQNDPHPHVNGGDGRPCLGSIDSSVAELCGSREYMVLACLLIDFVESVNVRDSAGEKVRFRNQVNPETGEILHEAEESIPPCDNCGRAIHNEDDLRTCENCGCDMCDNCACWVGEDDDTIVCGNCRTDRYTWHEDAEVWIHDEDYPGFDARWQEENEEE